MYSEKFYTNLIWLPLISSPLSFQTWQYNYHVCAQITIKLIFGCVIVIVSLYRQRVSYIRISVGSVSTSSG